MSCYLKYVTPSRCLKFPPLIAASPFHLGLRAQVPSNSLLSLPGTHSTSSTSHLKKLIDASGKDTASMAPSKRKTPSSSQEDGSPKTKKLKVQDYHLTPSVVDEVGEIIWPAPKDDIQAARTFIKECVASQSRTLICPDKDADGLSSGVILHHTLTTLGLDPSLITVHLLSKGTNIHEPSERDAMASLEPSYIFVLDQGSRKSPPLIPTSHRALIIDHHHLSTPDSFPSGAQHISASAYPPVATASLLTYTICSTLHTDLPSRTAWLCTLGTHGDLGNTLKWLPPFPDMSAVFSTHTRKAIHSAIPLINAPRRSPAYNVRAAWSVLLAASGPAPILSDPDFRAAKSAVTEEHERWRRAPPKFSLDGRVAVFRINSPAQVHPVIATSWAGHLHSKKLEVVMVANEGYMPGMVHFSCRIARSALDREERVDVIRVLKGIAEEGGEGLVGRLGENFARGHREASGGVVKAEVFEELVRVMRVGEKPEKKEGEPGTPSPEKKSGKKEGVAQKNTLANYFGKKT